MYADVERSYGYLFRGDNMSMIDHKMIDFDQFCYMSPSVVIWAAVSALAWVRFDSTVSGGVTVLLVSLWVSFKP